MNEYAPLIQSLSRNGIQCQRRSPNQLVLSGQAGPVWPTPGNSFWITQTGGHWYLFTWTPIGYLVPGTTDIEALCRACMAHGDSAMYRVPVDIVQGFGLRELAEDEADVICSKMDKGD